MYMCLRMETFLPEWNYLSSFLTVLRFFFGLQFTLERLACRVTRLLVLHFMQFTLGVFFYTWRLSIICKKTKLFFSPLFASKGKRIKNSKMSICKVLSENRVILLSWRRTSFSKKSNLCILMQKQRWNFRNSFYLYFSSQNSANNLMVILWLNQKHVLNLSLLFNQFGNVMPYLL